MRIPNPFRFLVAVSKVLHTALFKAEDPFAPPGVVQARTEVCDGCIYLDGDQCSVCRCFVGVKRLFRTESCPKGYWIR